MTPPLVIVHWAEWINSSFSVKLACHQDGTRFAMLTADGNSGLDIESRRFDFDTTRVTCLDCKARIAEALQVRP